MTAHAPSGRDSLHARDFHAWTLDQARRLRDSRPNAVEWELIAEELEDMGGNLRRELFSRLTTIVEHQLKLAYSYRSEPRRQWRGTVRTQRDALLRHIAQNPSLRPLLPVELPGAYREAAARIAPDLIDHTMDPLPDDCPFDLEDQILNPDWYPVGPDGTHGWDDK